jgi:hypothetical protein
MILATIKMGILSIVNVFYFYHFLVINFMYVNEIVIII